MTSIKTQPCDGLNGIVRVPSDKSISHRALIFSALAEGRTCIRNLLLSEDVMRTLTILNQLGVQTSHTAATITQTDELIVKGVGLHGFQESKDILYCGNSGTTMRLMLGLLAAQPFTSRLTGDASLNKRPMERVMEPLRKMGAEFSVEQKNGQRVICVNPELRTRFAVPLQGIEYKMPIASAQVKTAILIAGLYAQCETKIVERLSSRNHTEIMMAEMGIPIQTNGNRITLKAKTPHALVPPRSGGLEIPGDMSSAAFLIVAALITKKSFLMIKDVNLNPTRTGALDVLIQMGAQIEIHNQRVSCGEEVGDLHVRSSSLKNVTIAGEMIPRLIDELPILALAGACSEGEMIVKDAQELRVKETDRIKAICSELRKVGVKIEEREDGFVIAGVPTCRCADVSTFNQKRFTSYGDHRLAMMEYVAGLVLDHPTEIDDVDCIKTSFPNFFELIGKTNKTN